MHIKKIGHCCLVIDIDGKRIVTDPGMFTNAQNELGNIDAILITHEHQDHLHVPSVQAMLAKNPQAVVVTNGGVGAQLTLANVPFMLAEGRGKAEVRGVSFEAFDCRHEEIYGEIGQVQNTAYMVAGSLLLPGDSFFKPEPPVEILALPVAGPWCRRPDAIRYGLAVKPKKALPVHEAMIIKEARGLAHRIPGQILGEAGIAFTAMNEGDEADF